LLNSGDLYNNFYKSGSPDRCGLDGTGVQVPVFHAADFFKFNSIVKRDYYYGEFEDAMGHETRLFILWSSGL
jgi:hypothetical protein